MPLNAFFALDISSSSSSSASVDVKGSLGGLSPGGLGGCGFDDDEPDGLRGSTGGSEDEPDGFGGSNGGSDGFCAGVDGALCSGELSAKTCL